MGKQTKSKMLLVSVCEGKIIIHTTGICYNKTKENWLPSTRSYYFVTLLKINAVNSVFLSDTAGSTYPQ